MDYRNIKIDFKPILGLLISKIKMIGIAIVIFGLAGFIIGEFMVTKEYESTAQMYIVGKQDEAVENYKDVNSTPILLNDYKTLITSENVMKKVLAELGLTMDISDFVDKITISMVPDSRTLKITVRDKNVYNTKIIADVIADIAAESICEVMQVEAVNIFENGNVPVKAVRPNVVLYVIVGMLLGGIIEIGAIIVTAILDDTIKNPKDVRTYLGLDTLAFIQPAQDGYNGADESRKGSVRSTRSDIEEDER